MFFPPFLSHSMKCKRNHFILNNPNKPYKYMPNHSIITSTPNITTSRENKLKKNLRVTRENHLCQFNHLKILYTTKAKLNVINKRETYSIKPSHIRKETPFRSIINLHLNKFSLERNLF